MLRLIIILAGFDMSSWLSSLVTINVKHSPFFYFLITFKIYLHESLTQKK